MGKKSPSSKGLHDKQVLVSAEINETETKNDLASPELFYLLEFYAVVILNDE